MRKFTSLVTFVAVVAGVLLFFWNTEGIRSSASLRADGREVFLGSRCDSCHSVSTAGIEAKAKSAAMKGPDLVGLSGQRDAAWLTRYLHKQENLDGKSHKVAFKGSDEELAALIDWLLEQKSK